ncbi:nucleotidyltransferase domain-containing protein [Endozoicomonadaceae bacterium StTr2]
MDSITEQAVEEVVARYHPHTVIVYGSRARGEATASSDIDILCFVDSPEVTKDARLFNGVFLDAWIYSTDAMKPDEPEFLRLGDGVCVRDIRGAGQPFLDAIQHRISRGPERLTDEDKQHTREWVMKMMARTGQDDIEAYYRNSWLQIELLPIYFQLRDLWYFGPKKGFAWLKNNDPDGYQLFESTYANPRSKHDLDRLVRYVTD